jgi:hypothetical protein
VGAETWELENNEKGEEGKRGERKCRKKKKGLNANSRVGIIRKRMWNSGF